MATEAGSAGALILKSVTTFMRSRDVEAFRAAAQRFGAHILVRRTNPASLSYVGQRGYMPKPIDCKVKTADRDVVLASGKIVKCAGLVVNPTLPKFEQAFASAKKREKALKEWSAFNAKHGVTALDVERAVSSAGSGLAKSAGSTYLQGGSVRGLVIQGDRGGVYFMDIFEDSPHFGCLKFSPLALYADAKNLQADSLRELSFRKDACYLHGDYDVYDVVKAAPTAPAAQVRIQKLHGEKNYFRGNFGEIQDYLNRRIGTPMVQHGDQASYAQSDEDAVDVFWANGLLGSIEWKEISQIDAFYEREVRPNVRRIS